MEQQHIPLKEPDQLDVEIPKKYSDICQMLGDLYIRSTLNIRHIEASYKDRLQSLEARVYTLLQENEQLKRQLNEQDEVGVSDN